MSPRSLAASAVRVACWCCLAWLAVAACEDARVAEIRTRAHQWVERLHDTASVDSLAAELPDSAQLDSLASAWTPEDWVRFWEEVEREEARRR